MALRGNTLRFARWIIVGAALAMGAVLVFKARRTSQSIHEATADLHRGQAAALLDNFYGYLRQEGRPSQTDLENWLLEEQEDGVKFVMVSGRVNLSAGEASTPPNFDLPKGKTLWVQATDNRVRLLARGPRRRKNRKRLSSRLDTTNQPEPALNSQSKPARRGKAKILIEFEPTAWNQLLSEASSDVWLSGLLGSGLFCLSIVAFFWIRRREQLDVHVARQEHLARLGEVSAVLAHEIRNPLASLKGNAQLLQESAPEEKSQKQAQRIVHEAMRLEKLTTDLMEFVRTGKIARIETNPKEIVEAVATSVGLTISLQSKDAPEFWMLDTPRFRQVITNLLLNAKDASPETHPSVSISKQQGALLISVRDKGPGISPERLETIFNPFVTEKTKGTGLGLAICRRIVEAHGGRIWAENQPSGGANIQMLFPSSDA